MKIKYIWRVNYTEHVDYGHGLQIKSCEDIFITSSINGLSEIKDSYRARYNGWIEITYAEYLGEAKEV